MGTDTPDGAGARHPVFRMHATCVAIGGHGVLLRGPPSTGKSDLALRLIAETPPPAEPPAYLVADDQVEITRDGKNLTARAPEPIAGMLEIRGVGIRRVPSVPQVPVALIVDLVPRDAIPRLPPEPSPTEDILGLPVRTARLTPFEASATLKLRALLGAWGASPI